MALLTEAESHPTAPRDGGGAARTPAPATRSTGPSAAVARSSSCVLFNFFLFRVMPGDPIGLYTRGRNVDPEQIRPLRATLDKPLPQQLLEYLQQPVHRRASTR